MNTIILIAKYWGLVFKRGALSILYDVKENWKKWIILILALFILSVLTTNNILPRIIGPFLEDISSEVRVGVMSIAIVLLLWAILTPVYMPAKIYDEMGGFVKSPLKLVPDSLSKSFVSLKVENLTPYDVTDCTLELEEVVNINSGQSVLLHAEKLTWSSREHSRTDDGINPKTISIDNPRVCDVAEAKPDEQKVVFTTRPPRKSERVGAGTYALFISLSGRWQEKRFSDDWKFLLKYGNELSIELLTVSGDED